MPSVSWARNRASILVAAFAAMALAWPAGAEAQGTSIDQMQAQLAGEFHSQAEAMAKSMGTTGAAVAPSAAQTPSVPAAPAPPTAPPPAPAASAPAASSNGGAAAPSAGEGDQTPTTDPPPADPPPTSSAPDPGQSNTNVSIRVLSPGNDGAVVQQNSSAGAGGNAPSPVTDASPTPSGIPAIDHLVQNQSWTVKGIEVTLRVEGLPAAPSLPSASDMEQTMRHAFGAPLEPPHTPKALTPSAQHRHKAAIRHVRAAPPVMPAIEPVALTQARSERQSARPATKPRHPSRRHERQGPAHPFPLPRSPFDQTVGAGSAGGSSTPPPAPMAVLLAAACFGASMLVTALWGAHRRRRSRLFASRLERPG